jgi:hypothetical protein
MNKTSLKFGKAAEKSHRQNPNIVRGKPLVETHLSNPKSQLYELAF